MGDIPDLRNFLQGGHSGNPLFWIVYLGDDPQNWVDPRHIPPQGGPPSVINLSKSRHGRAVGVTATGRSRGGSGTTGGEYIHTLSPEHHFPVYPELSYTGSMYGGRMASISMGDTAVVVAGGSIPRPGGR